MLNSAYTRRVEAEDWVRRHVADRGGYIQPYGFDGGDTLVVYTEGRVFRATSLDGDEASAWELVADMMAPFYPEDDPSEIGDYE